MRLVLDHIAVAAVDLDAGVAHVRDALGITVPPGGSHPLMGTHNHLARLGENEFLEVLAADPDAAPGRPRWFDLDRLGDAAPHLATWVVRCDDLDAALARLPPECGPAVDVTRGDLAWRLSVPEDGSMPWGGMFPTIIEWPMRPLPATRMADVGCTLEGLTVRHPEADRIEALLGAALDDPRVRFEPGEAVGLEATVRTPDGVRRLR